MTKPPTTDHDDSRQRRYVARMLRMDPLEDAAGVLSLRRRALGLRRIEPLGQEAARPEREEHRRTLREYVKTLQQGFWKFPLDKLQQALASIDLRDVPELEPTVGRLREVASSRAEFPRLAATPGVDLAMFRAFKSAAVMPAVEAGPERERFLHSITSRKRLMSAKRTARLIREQFPELYQLERDWLATIETTKRPRATADSMPAVAVTGSRPFELPFQFGWPMWIVVWIVLRLLLSLMN